ncbi:MAG: hypothetical protein ABIG61_16535 [Planctomycetota bacterium]
MKKLMLNILIGELILAGWATCVFAADDVTPNGPEIIIQAEDCTITALGGGYITGAAPPEWAAATPVVSLASGIAGLENGYGDIKFTFPGSIPDGDYTLSVKWHTAEMAGQAWGFMIDSESAGVAEGSFPGGQWHYFYPGKPDIHDDQWFEDELTGPNGLSFATYSGTPVRPYMTVKGIGNNDFYVRVSDMAIGQNNYMAIDYFVLQSVTVANKSIHVEAEDCTIAAVSPNTYWRIDGPLIFMATNASGNTQSAVGNIAFYLPPVIPDGTYTLKLGYRIGGTWEGAGSSFKIAPAGGSSGTIHEDGIITQNGWHTFYPVGYALYEVDDLAGLAGLSFPVDPGTPIADSVTVSNIASGEFVIYIWDQSANSYDFFGIDFFELIPVSE